VNFAQQGQAMPKNPKALPKPVLEEKKDAKRNKKRSDGASINAERSPEEMPEPPISDRNKNTFRKSFSTMKGAKLGIFEPRPLMTDMSNMANTDETVSDSETIGI
jgi:hypothetical protein